MMRWTYLFILAALACCGYFPVALSQPMPSEMGINSAKPFSHQQGEAFEIPAAPIEEPPQALTVEWQYKPDAKQYLGQALGNYQQLHGHFPSNIAANQLAKEAFAHATYLKPLKQWGLRSDTHPWVIQPSVILTNPTDTPWLDATVTVWIDICWGDLRVDSKLFLTDLYTLQSTAQWKTARQSKHPVAILSPGDSTAIKLTPLELLPLITPSKPTANSDRALSDRWPTAVRLRATLSPKQTDLPAEQHTQTIELPLYPDYFLTPFHPLRGSV